MRIPLPDNITWADRDRVVLPAGLAIVWHGNAVEVADDMPAKNLDELRAALLAFDPKAPTPAELEFEAVRIKAKEARDAMEQDKGKDPKADAIHARLLALEMAAGLITGAGEAKAYHK